MKPLTTQNIEFFKIGFIINLNFILLGYRLILFLRNILNKDPFFATYNTINMSGNFESKGSTSLRAECKKKLKAILKRLLKISTHSDEGHQSRSRTTNLHYQHEHSAQVSATTHSI